MADARNGAFSVAADARKQSDVVSTQRSPLVMRMRTYAMLALTYATLIGEYAALAAREFGPRDRRSFVPQPLLYNPQRFVGISRLFAVV